MNTKVFFFFIRNLLLLKYQMKSPFYFFLRFFFISLSLSHFLPLTFLNSIAPSNIMSREKIPLANLK